MTFKEIEATFNMARDCGREIEEKRRAMLEARETATSIVPRPRDDAGISMSKDPHKKIEQYILKEEQLAEDINRLTAMRYRAMELIELLDSSQDRAILYAYYINRDSWEQVSESQHINHQGRTVFYHRIKAFKEIEEKTSHLITL